MLKVGGTVWVIDSGGNRYVGNVPSFGTDRQSARIEGPETRIDLERPSSIRPAVEVVPENPVKWGVTWEQNEAEDYVAATVKLSDDDVDGDPTGTARIQPRPSSCDHRERI